MSTKQQWEDCDIMVRRKSKITFASTSDPEIKTAFLVGSWTEAIMKKGVGLFDHLGNLLVSGRF